MKRTTIGKDIENEIKKGDLVRIRCTGEVFIYDTGVYAVNWNWKLTDNRGNYYGQHNLFDLQVVDKSGLILKEWLQDD